MTHLPPIEAPDTIRHAPRMLGRQCRSFVSVYLANVSHGIISSSCITIIRVVVLASETKAAIKLSLGQLARPRLHICGYLSAVIQHGRNITLRTTYGNPWHGAHRATGARTTVHAMGRQGHRAPAPTAAPQDVRAQRHMYTCSRPTGSRAPAPI